MKNSMMAEKELNVKVGDRVSVQGNCGTVLEVSVTKQTEWNAEKKLYEEVEGSEATYVRVNFDSDNELHNTCYNNEWYGGYWVI